MLSSIKRVPFDSEYKAQRIKEVNQLIHWCVGVLSNDERKTSMKKAACKLLNYRRKHLKEVSSMYQDEIRKDPEWKLRGEFFKEIHDAVNNVYEKYAIPFLNKSVENTGE